MIENRIKFFHIDFGNHAAFKVRVKVSSNVSLSFVSKFFSSNEVIFVKQSMIESELSPILCKPLNGVYQVITNWVE